MKPHWKIPEPSSDIQSALDHTRTYQHYPIVVTTISSPKLENFDSSPSELPGGMLRTSGIAVMI